MTDATYNLNGGFKPTTKRFADLDGPDFYPTPRWATFALIENERFRGGIWECACGDGAMSEVLSKTGNAAASSDLYDRTCASYRRRRKRSAGGRWLGSASLA
jgi:hypothetical protein